MNCVTIQSLLLDYSRGLLSDEINEKISCHLDNCPRCHLVSESFKIFSASGKIKLWFDKYRKTSVRVFQKAA
jgi:hypothetical protein